MRAIISKVLTGSLIAGAALAVSACGPKTETTTDNTMVTDMNTTDMGTMSDNMTAVDGGMNGGMMANDGMMSNDTTMMSNESMSTTTNM
ncbi:hypothetical protein GGQ80_002500 [Sphingomonas jinjuensis]|uniref:Uncharacterized protein n=1 Tax=Sphingomonas jinjuensis TaxID=535907 RepID=A0A840FFU5_9SPHN|nr:hypothetical protein [Sphingomonas jinjuensis]MBB4154584.1 hypothetical protein [Sphingomonas jinjuensis]